IKNGTLLIKGQTIQSVAAGTAVPKGYVVIDLEGKFIYPSLVDAFTSYGLPETAAAAGRGFGGGGGGARQSIFTSTKKGAYGWNEAIRPEVQVSTVFAADSKKADDMRKAGFGAVNAINRDGIARGISAAVSLSDEKENSTLLNAKASANYSFNKGTSQNDYPTSLMGSIALLRQTYYDAQWYSKQKEEYNISLAEFNNQQSIPQLFEVDGWQNVLRADKIGKEFGKQYIIKSGGDEYQRIDAIKATGASLIVPINFVKAYEVEDSLEARNITLAQMKGWELAPTNPAVLEKAGIKFSITAFGLDNVKDFWTNIRTAIENGLTEKQALLAVTEIPAGMIGIADKVGTLEKGKLANFIITSDSLFKKTNVIEENWVQGKRFILVKKDASGNVTAPKDSTNRMITRKPEPKKPVVMGSLIYPFTAFGTAKAPAQETVLLKNATVWTNEKEGILQNADVLIENGKIKAVGKNLAAGSAKVIDATGKHITPGIIDEHSHIAGAGGINEGAQSSSAEVRITDVINSEDVNIYRQLAGGVTTSHILHGSANPIGGQSQLIKLRWGKLPEELKFAGADGFIKFALGE
ncbi:MAG: amidohydrolase, partial [Pedobacter sp.]